MNLKNSVLATLILSGLSAGRACAQADAPANPPAAAAPTTQPGVTLVNIHMQKAMPEDVFDELAKQGGIKFSAGNNLWDQDAMQSGMDVDLTNRPFWSAVREVCGLWNITPQTNDFGNRGRRIQLQLMQMMGGQASQWNKAPTCESQGFMVQAVSFNRQQSINYTMPGNVMNMCSIQLIVYVDPSLRLSNGNVTCKADEAADDAGNSMLPDKGNNNNMFYGNGQQRSLIFNCGVVLKYPDKAGKKISHLKCTLVTRGSDKFDTMTIDKPLEAEESSKSFGDVTITFHSLKKPAQGGNYELKVGVTKEDDQNVGNDLGLIQSAQLLDEKGRPFANVGGGSSGNGTGTYEYTVTYTPTNGEAAGNPAKWTIELPSKSHAIKVPLEFTDLPLP